jgi:hypothetical protein
MRKSSVREIQYRRQSETSQETQSLIQLPNWDGIGDIGVSVRASTTREERINIVLHT